MTNELVSRVIASLLWDVGAFKVSLDEPFKLVSGNYSPIYVNCRLLISNAAAMDVVTSLLHWRYMAENLSAGIIAGGETAGIPFASYLAQRLGKPMVYVMKRPKEHGVHHRFS